MSRRFPKTPPVGPDGDYIAANPVVGLFLEWTVENHKDPGRLGATSRIHRLVMFDRPISTAGEYIHLDTGSYKDRCPSDKPILNFRCSDIGQHDIIPTKLRVVG
jgi:hypothetical protein